MDHRNTCFSNANLSLCGCGFLCIYHAGVCAALREYAPQLTRNRIYGASAGSIAAAGLICNVSVAEATTAILQVVAEARSGLLQAFSPTFHTLYEVIRGQCHEKSHPGS
uniref:PNPLA domain-containing protein n=1 Tax=Globodera pallida TaxID=36090 RepID=A0A183C382_GLOPA